MTKRATRQKSQSVTIQTVADRAGVSAMTVSNVVNNRRNVRSATREVVLAAIRELDYRPNPAARSLASAATVRIGLFVGKSESGFVSSILSGALEESSSVGAQLLMRRFEGFDFRPLVAAAEAMAASGVGAIVMPPPMCESLLAAGALSCFPVPIVAICPGDEIPGVPSVRIDDRSAAREMTAYLLSLGHRRIGFVRIGADLLADRTRQEGYVDALAEAGIAYDERLVASGQITFESGLHAAEQLLSLEPRPTAIFASNDEMAAAVVSLAHRKGLDIPGELSVAGFDDGPLAIKLWPALTTVHQPVAGISSAALRRAVEIARAPDAPVEPDTTYLPYRLVVRESTAPPPA